MRPVGVSRRQRMQNMMQTAAVAPVFNNGFQQHQRVVALGQRVLQSDSVGPELRVEAVTANARQQKALKVQNTEPVSQLARFTVNAVAVKQDI